MWHTIGIDEARRKLRTNFNVGLTGEEVLRRREEFGENKIADSKKDSLFIKFIKQFNDFMIMVLIGAAVVSAVMSYIEGSNDYIDSIIIIFIVALNAVLGLVQENKAEKSLEALKNMSAPTAKVKRNGAIARMPSGELVPGDIIIVEAGGYVPADARLIKAYNLKVEESSLTGETAPVSKNADVILQNNIPTGDMINMIWSSTIVAGGHGEAVITEIGMDTKIGHIAAMIISDESPETPLQRKLRRSGEKVGTCSTCNMFFNICYRNS
ncbi:MAG: HAD-IC family P-type ATPase [Firmicutes bacterium]|nr:HAD-IC family P-type ATPase [Bacillota bacterium]